MSNNVKQNASITSKQLRITEIFYSLQGESNTVGIPTVFIRLTGCPLRCQYCDTAYAFTGGESMAIAAILEKVKSYKASYVTVTGGEPLAQAQCHGLLSRLCDEGYQVSLETSGAIDISHVDGRVTKVVDIKTPDSGEESRNLWRNLDFIQEHDQIKFIICSRADYEWSCGILEKHKLATRCQVLFSPSYEQLPATTLAEWILEDQIPVRFQMQLHKVLWGNEPGR